MRASRGAVVASDFLAWAVLHGLTGYLAYRVPLERYERDGWLFKERAIERGGRLYADRLGIRRWKHLLPDAGGWFAAGFPKAKLASADRAYLERFVAETRRAELGHWLAVASTPLFALWNPARVLPIQAAYAVASNGPCIVAQRYNRIRLRRVIDRHGPPERAAGTRSPSAPTGRPRPPDGQATGSPGHRIARPPDR